MSKNALGHGGSKEIIKATKDTVLDFGQYKGQTVREVMEHDAPYLLWADREVGHFIIDDVLLLDEITELAIDQDYGQDSPEEWTLGN